MIFANNRLADTAQKMKFSIKNFLMENFIFCAVKSFVLSNLIESNFVYKILKISKIRTRKILYLNTFHALVASYNLIGTRRNKNWSPKFEDIGKNTSYARSKTFHKVYLQETTTKCSNPVLPNVSNIIKPELVTLWYLLEKNKDC